MMMRRIKADLDATFREDSERKTHVYGVLSTALALARLHKIDGRKAALASLLHDMTKHLTEEAHRRMILRGYGEWVLHAFAPPLYHAFSAVVLAHEHYGVKDLDVLQAIESHTIGRAGMTPLEKIVFISDYTEPNRPYEACREVREVAFKDLDKAVYMAMDNSIRLFEKEGGFIPKTAYEAREYYRERGNAHG